MKGFFSFIVVFFILILLITSITIFQKNNNELNSLKIDLIEIEQKNLERTILENNIDKIISISLTNETYKTNDVVKIKKEINKKLFNYLQDKAFATDFFIDSKKQLTMNFLNKNSSVAVYEINSLFYAEYTYSSNITKQEYVANKLGNKTKLVFKIPIDYSKKIVGGKA